MISEDIYANFEVLQEAFKVGQVVVLECVKDGKKVAVVCVVEYDDLTQEAHHYPVAELIQYDDLDQYEAPEGATRHYVS